MEVVEKELPTILWRVLILGFISGAILAALDTICPQPSLFSHLLASGPHFWDKVTMGGCYGAVWLVLMILLLVFMVWVCKDFRRWSVFMILMVLIAGMLVWGIIARTRTSFL